jgi:hypothetical protein
MPPIIDWQFRLRVPTGRVTADAGSSVWAVDVPTWITAIATAGLLAGAIVTAIYAIRAFRAQAKEISDQARMLEVQSEQLAEQRKLTNLQTPVLELQATELRESLDERKREAEQRKRDAEQSRRAQASKVYLREEHHANDPRVRSTLRELGGAHPTAYAHVKNTSQQPIYEAELRWHRGSEGHGDPNPEPLGTIMPDVEISKMRDFPPGTNMAAGGAILRFRDAAGAWWIRRPDGGLVEQQ